MRNTPRVRSIITIVMIVMTSTVVGAFAATARSRAVNATRVESARADCRVSHPHSQPTARASWAAGLSQFATETIQITVKPGPLRVSPPRATVTLHRAGDMLEGTLGPIDVIDARGTFPGWELVAKAVARTQGGVVTFLPATPEMVYGEPDGLLAGPGGNNNAVIACASPDHGGGTYRVTGVVRMRPAHMVDALDLTVELRAR